MDMQGYKELQDVHFKFCPLRRTTRSWLENGKHYNYEIFWFLKRDRDSEVLYIDKVAGLTIEEL
jgi:hypothetical protein